MKSTKGRRYEVNFNYARIIQCVKRSIFNPTSNPTQQIFHPTYRKSLRSTKNVNKEIQIEQNIEELDRLLRDKIRDCKNTSSTVSSSASRNFRGLLEGAAIDRGDSKRRLRKRNRTSNLRYANWDFFQIVNGSTLIRNINSRSV